MAHDSRCWDLAYQRDQIDRFFYFGSINFQKAAGGFGPIRVNDRNVIAVPFLKPEDEFDLLVGDWSFDNYKHPEHHVDEWEATFRLS
ncbi:Monocopper oxidase-like protein SKS1, partial [Cucurbita argyrosperma subsp. sororia]